MQHQAKVLLNPNLASNKNTHRWTRPENTPPNNTYPKITNKKRKQKKKTNTNTNINTTTKTKRRRSKRTPASPRPPHIMAKTTSQQKQQWNTTTASPPPPPPLKHHNHHDASPPPPPHKISTESTPNNTATKPFETNEPPLSNLNQQIQKKEKRNSSTERSGWKRMVVLKQSHLRQWKATGRRWQNVT